MSYLNNIEDDWRADKITRNEFVELKRAYNNATPEEKKAMEQARAMGVEYVVKSNANGSNSKTSEQKILEAIRSNTSTIVNIMVFHLVLLMVSAVLMILTFNQL
jgi:hypothetical protein